MAQVIPEKVIHKLIDICMASDSCDAVFLAEQLMEESSVRMHGPEHHFLVAAAILSAYCNQYCVDEKYRFLKMAAVRTVKIPVATCALYGTCGAMMGAGAAVSILLKANPFAKEPLVIVNRVTASIQKELASYSGIRCCKRAVWASVKGAVRGLNESGASNLPCQEVRCSYAGTHDACIGNRCNYI